MAVECVKMYFSEENVKLSGPGLYVISGATNCGKSCLTRDILVRHCDVFVDKISKIYYCYSNYQRAFDELSNDLGSKIQFVQGFSGTSFFTEHGLNNRTEYSETILIALDDCLEEILSKKDSLLIFSRLTHHRNVIFLLQTQLLLPNSDLFRSIVKVSLSS